MSDPSLPFPSGGAKVLRVETASFDVLVVVVETNPGVATPTQDPARWMVNGIPPIAVGRWSYPWHVTPEFTGYQVTLRHHLYLDLGTPLVRGEAYAIDTPYGPVDLEFSECAIVCESIHVNQVGYFRDSTVRYANLGVFLGDLGPRFLAPPLNYVLVHEGSGAVVHGGQAAYWGDQTGTFQSSGEYVYRLDLAPLPPGGPYHIILEGFGRSHSFGVGPPWSRELAYVHSRGIYHQRCGTSLDQPYTDHTRGACHTTVQTTDAEPPDFITLGGPTRSIRGGHHDAGDFDRRLVHTLIPAWMLNTYEAFPDHFWDSQMNIPESGNGIPDWLDEALWGVLVWEELQEPDGGVRAGTEADRHPVYGVVNAETDYLVYGTFRRDGHTTASAAGLFAHASRLIQPFDPVRAASLLGKAQAAWLWVQANNPPSAHDAQRMYAALQLYLATGDPAYHTAFLTSEGNLLNAPWPEVYNPEYFNLPTTWDGMIYSPYFFAYTITTLPVDAAVRQRLITNLRVEADVTVANLNATPYPLGPATPFGWGNVTNQGRYADPVILTYRLTGEQRYLDAASQLADYSAGLNPIGKCYTTGLGANPPNNPLQLDSYFTDQRGLGPVPGITVYGPMVQPGFVSYQVTVWSKVYPDWQTLPEQRRYCEGWSLVTVNEFSVTETIALNACLYGFLAGQP